MFVPAFRLQLPAAQQACLTPAVGSEWVRAEGLVFRLVCCEAVTPLRGVGARWPLRGDEHPATLQATRGGGSLTRRLFRKALERGKKCDNYR